MHSEWTQRYGSTGPIPMDVKEIVIVCDKNAPTRRRHYQLARIIVAFIAEFARCCCRETIDTEQDRDPPRDVVIEIEICHVLSGDLA
jgi:hypothetical protein